MVWAVAEQEKIVSTNTVTFITARSICMTRKAAIITGVAGLSALAMVAPAARAEDSKEANPEVEKFALS